MNDFLKDILPIGVLFTFIGTLVTIYYTRRNLKTSKYIETITTERIKWIEKLRNDISQLISWITIYTYNKHEIIELKKRNDSIMENGHYDHDVDSFVPDFIDEEELSGIGKEFDFYNKELNSISRERIIEKINLIKLRLNPSDDYDAIQLLDRLIYEVIMVKFTEGQQKITQEIIDQFIKLVQKLLKSEWDKVKRETKKGK